MTKTRKNNGVITVALLAVFLGLLAGVAGQLLAREYLSQSWYSFPFGGELNLTQTGLNNPNLVIKDAQNISVQQEKKVRETVDSASKSLVGIFSRKQELSSSEADLSSIDVRDHYNLADPVEQGFIITSDGWVLTPRISALQAEESRDQLVAITKEREIYEIDAVKEASNNNFSFIRLKNADELPVKKFASEEELRTGEIIVALNWQEKGFLTSLVGKKQQNGIVRSSDVFREELQLADSLPEYYNSAFLFNLKDGIVGVYDGQGGVNSINNFRVQVRNLLEKETGGLPSLGVNYVDLFEVLLTSQEYEKGALIYPNENGVAVQENSAAEAAGLKRGDVITAVNNKKIDENTSLNYLISGKTAGETITLTYSRDGDSETTSLTLPGDQQQE